MSGAVLISAHFGHWYISLPVFLGPVLVIVAWLKIGDWRARRRDDDETPERRF